MNPSKQQAAEATEALNRIKASLRLGRISYDNAKHFSQPYLDTLNAYAKNRAKAAGLTTRSISFTGFMR